MPKPKRQKITEPADLPEEVTTEPAPTVATKKSSKPAASVAKPIVPPTAPSVVRAVGGTQSPRKLLWLWITLGAVVLVGATVAGFMYFSRPAETLNENTNEPAVTNTNSEEIAPRVIDGVMVPATETNPPLAAVMIENMTTSRPPSGLDRAKVVYEALAEGGITRFLAMFVTTDLPAEIGPVRSARPYFVDWASEYNKPLYAHAGGSPQALDLLRSSKTTVVDFNQFYRNVYFRRDKTRYAPHNLYTSGQSIALALKQVAKNTTSTFTGWSYEDEAELAERPETVKPIVINFSSLGYRVTYNYNREDNVYVRTNGTEPHVTRDGHAIAAKNVIVQYVPTTLYPNEKQRLKMTTVGQGKAIVFSNGTAIVGTWKKDATANRTEFFDETGSAVTLARGTTWVEVLPVDRTVTY